MLAALLAALPTNSFHQNPLFRIQFTNCIAQGSSNLHMFYIGGTCKEHAHYGLTRNCLESTTRKVEVERRWRRRKKRCTRSSRNSLKVSHFLVRLYTIEPPKLRILGSHFVFSWECILFSEIKNDCCGKGSWSVYLLWGSFNGDFTVEPSIDLRRKYNYVYAFCYSWNYWDQGHSDGDCIWNACPTCQVQVSSGFLKAVCIE